MPRKKSMPKVKKDNSVDASISSRKGRSKTGGKRSPSPRR